MKRRKSDGTEDDEIGSERTCIVTREKRSPDEMIRFVLDPSGQVTPDIRRKLPGRGVWVGAKAKLLAEGAKRGAFSKAFKQPAALPDDLAVEVDRLLEQDLLQALSMANKAGVVAAGAFKVEEALTKGQTAMLVLARDSGGDGRKKFRQYRNYLLENGIEVYCLEFLDSEQIGLALGRASVVHAALRRSAATAALIARAQRLEAYRREDGTQAPPSDQEIDSPAGQQDGHGPGS